MLKKTIFILLIMLLMSACSGGGFEGVEIGNPAAKAQGQIVMVPDVGDWFYKISFISPDMVALERLKKTENTMPTLPFKEVVVSGDRALVPYTLDAQGVVSLAVEFADQETMTMQFELLEVDQGFQANLQSLQINNLASSAQFNVSFKKAQSAITGEYQPIFNECQNDGQNLSASQEGPLDSGTQYNFSGAFNYSEDPNYVGVLDGENYLSFINEGLSFSAICYATLIEGYFSGACQVMDIQQELPDEICFFAYQKL